MYTLCPLLCSIRPGGNSILHLCHWHCYRNMAAHAHSAVQHLLLCNSVSFFFSLPLPPDSYHMKAVTSPAHYLLFLLADGVWTSKRLEGSLSAASFS